MTTSLGAWLSALLMTAATALVLPGSATAVARLGHARSSAIVPQRTRSSQSLQAMSIVLAGAAVASFVGGVIGVVVGLAASFVLRKWLATLPRSDDLSQLRRRRAELPAITDLLAACLASGATDLRSLQVVSETASSGVRPDLQRVVVALKMGASPNEAWDMLDGTDLGQIAVVMRRSAETGAPAASLLTGLASDLRGQFRAAALSDARRLGVRAAGPLGLCFLPAFVLIGVVPLVLSLVRTWV